MESREDRRGYGRTAKGMKRDRKHVDGLDKDIKNMKGTEDPESSIYIYILQSCVSKLSCCLFFPPSHGSFLNFDFSIVGSGM